jgi:FMN phosphatase YigB (HAD superfamily)
MKNLKVIAFDADDTLFINETYFAETEQNLWLNGRLFVASKYF